MAQLLKDLNVDRVSLVDRAAVRDPQAKSEPRRLLFWKREGDNDDKGAQMTEQELQAALEKTQGERDTALADLKKAQDEMAATARKRVQDGDDDDQPREGETSKKDEPINKDDLPPAVRAALEKAEAKEAAAEERLAKAESQAEAASQIAKEERDRRENAEAIAKAEEIAFAVGDPEVAGPILKSAREKLTKEEYEWLEKRLTAINSQIASSELFKQFGSSEEGGRASGDVYEEIEKRAAVLRKDQPTLSAADALVQVTKDDPDLQRRYLAAGGR